MTVGRAVALYFNKAYPTIAVSLSSWYAIDQSNMTAGDAVFKHQVVDARLSCGSYPGESKIRSDHSVA